MNTRLMIVDDHAGSREMIRKFLNLPGFTFQECASGEEALACVREFKPHWVIMDIKLPGMNGFASTKAIRQAHPQARVLMVTAYDDAHFRRLSQSVGATGFVLKENILALRLILEDATKNIKSSSSIPANIGSSAP